MPCKSYKDTLIEAASSDIEPQGDLRAHLASCADCRAAFEQERSLFASIESGLRVAANFEVPASLLPRVRARLDEVPAPRSIWATNWLVWASAAVLVVAFFTARAVWRTPIAHPPAESAANNPLQSPATAPPQTRDSAIEPPQRKNGAPKNHFAIARNQPASKSPASGESMPEVLVPHDQETLLAAYAEQWSRRKHPLLVAQDFDPTILPPLQIAPIQIDELGVKLLADEKSQ
jgi:hypothetical protein